MEDNCSKNKSCASNESSCCHSHEKQHKECDEGNHDGFAKFLLEVADEAWTEVLKDQIKEHILSTQKDRMKELAKIVSEGNSQRWKNKMEKKSGCAEFKEKLCNFFGQHKK